MLRSINTVDQSVRGRSLACRARPADRRAATAMLGLKTLADAVSVAAVGAASAAATNASASVLEPTERQRLEAEAERRLARQQRAHRDRNR